MTPRASARNQRGLVTPVDPPWSSTRRTQLFVSGPEPMPDAACGTRYLEKGWHTTEINPGPDLIKNQNQSSQLANIKVFQVSNHRNNNS
jgi:hypothetical protein